MSATSSPSEPTTETPSATSVAAAFAVALGMIFGVYWTTFVDMVAIWNIDPNYSHGFVVPVVSAVMAYSAWRSRGEFAFSPVDVSAVLIGVISLLLGLTLHAYAWFVSNHVLNVVSLIFVMRGALSLLGGKALAKQFGFPIIFLIFMAPLPIAWYQPIALMMQHLVSVVSTVVLEAFGATVYREGYLIQLPGYRMEVGEACSGLRQLTAVVALAVGIGYFSGRGVTYRWILGLLSVPIAIGANCLRVVLTGVILMLAGPKWAEGVFHTLEGLVMVGVAAALTVAVAKGLAAFEDYWKGEGADGDSLSESPAEPAAG